MKKECDSIYLLLYDLVVIVIKTVAAPWIEQDVPSTIHASTLIKIKCSFYSISFLCYKRKELVGKSLCTSTPSPLPSKIDFFRGEGAECTGFRENENDNHKVTF